MTSSAAVRRGGRSDREQIGVDTEHRRVVVDLPSDGGAPDGTGIDEPLPAPGPQPVDAVALEIRPDGPLAPSTVGVRVAQEAGAPARQAFGRVEDRRHGDGHDVHAHRP